MSFEYLNQSLAGAALAIARAGLPVFPCSASKAPLTGHGYKDATTDEAQVRAWWGQGSQSNIGVPTGARSGIDVLDFDSLKSLAEVERRFGPIETRRVKTPRGGAHFYFRHAPERPFPTKTNALKDCGIPQVDTRGNGGYVLVPPSRTDRGKYERENDLPIVPAPDWLWALLRPKAARGDPLPASTMGGLARHCLEKALAETGDGVGDDVGFKLACQLRDNRIGEALAITTLEQYAQQATRNPARPFDQMDVKRWWESTTSKPARQPWSASGRPCQQNSAKTTETTQATAPTEPPLLEIALRLYRPFPLDLLPPALADWIRKWAKAIPCDPAMIALPALAMLAGAVGATRRIKLKQGWTEPAVLWTAIVAASGSTKSPALDTALGPIQTIEKKAWQKYKQMRAAWVEEVDAYKQAPKNERPPSPPEKPKPRRSIVGDVTIEALAPLLVDNPRGLLLARDELAGWITGMSQYKGGKGDDLEKWLEMYGARALRVDRKAAEQRFLYVPYAAVSITGGIQPGTLRRVIGAQERESGFLARLMLACPPETPKRWSNEDADEQGDKRIQDILERLLGLDFERSEDGEDKPVELWLAPDAREPFINWVNELGEETLGMKDELLRAALAKIEGVAARLALVLHLAELADQGGAMSAPVSRLAIERGIGLARWLAAETRRVYRLMAEGEADREARQLAEAVARMGGRATARDVARSLRRYRDKGGMERAEAVLKRLAEAGLGEWAEREGGDQGGRPVYELVLHGEGWRQNFKNPNENAGSVAVTGEEREVIEL